MEAENKASQTWLQGAWVKRSGEVTADAETLAIGAAIQAGAATADYTDPEAAKKASAALWDIRAKSGSLLAEIIKWRKLHPPLADTIKDEKNIRAEILRLAGEKADAAWDELPAAGDGPMVLPPRD